MPRRLPPLNALKAFEAAARHESFTRAAEELSVTQGAVSHQVKALEAELGLKLFNRERQRLVITEAGRDYLVVVRDALDRIAMGTERLFNARRPALSPSARHRTLPPNGWCTVSDASPRRTRISISEFPRRCIMSILPMRTLIWLSVMATAAGPAWMQHGCAPRSCFQSAVQSSSPAVSASKNRWTS